MSTNATIEYPGLKQQALRTVASYVKVELKVFNGDDLSATKNAQWWKDTKERSTGIDIHAGQA